MRIAFALVQGFEKVVNDSYYGNGGLWCLLDVKNHIH